MNISSLHHNNKERAAQEQEFGETKRDGDRNGHGVDGRGLGNASGHATTRSLGRSWRRRKSARPGEILEVATAIFFEKGYAAAAMADIAAGAGVTKGTIYLYFLNKKELFKAIVQQHVAAVLAAPFEGGHALDCHGSEFAAALFDPVEIARFAGSRTVWTKGPNGENDHVLPNERSWRAALIDSAMDVFPTVFEDIVEQDKLRRVDPVSVAKACVAGVQFCPL